MNLLDLDIQKYVFKWEGLETSGKFKFIPEVQNENEEPIGKIELKGGLFQKIAEHAKDTHNMSEIPDKILQKVKSKITDV